MSSKELDEFSDALTYHSVLLVSLVILLSIYKTTVIGKSPYVFLFFFLLVNYCFIKYFIRCRQRFVFLIKRKYPLSVTVLVGSLISTALWLAVDRLMLIFNGRAVILNQLLLDKQITSHPKMLVPQAFDVTFTSPVIEEIMYRGLLLNAILYIGMKLGLSKKLLFVIFLFLTTVLFGISHASNNFLTFVGFGLMGLTFGALYLVSGNLIVPILVHFINNLSVQVNARDTLKIISIVVALLLIIGPLEYFSKDDRNFVKKFLCGSTRKQFTDKSKNE